MGGGNRPGARLDCFHCGLSPRGRGKRELPPGGAASARSIPAWAGETARRRGGRRGAGVYPRVGGGNCKRQARLCAPPGLSPRGRGKRWREGTYILQPGSIPAWAGETERMKCAICGEEVYPRVGGGNPAAAPFTAPCQGLSPRGRGKRRERRGIAVAARSIPAWAGETTMRNGNLRRKRVYPRVGGGNRPQSEYVSISGGLSPRGRGKLQIGIAVGCATGSIPAWAGETDENVR